MGSVISKQNSSEYDREFFGHDEQKWHIEYVERGDSWPKLAEQAGISIEELKKKNGITNRNDALHIGQSIWMPGE